MTISLQRPCCVFAFLQFHERVGLAAIKAIRMSFDKATGWDGKHVTEAKCLQVGQDCSIHTEAVIVGRKGFQ